MISLPVLTFMSHCHIVGEAFKDSEFISNVETFMSLCLIVGEASKDRDFNSSVDLHESMSSSRGGIQVQLFHFQM